MGANIASLRTQRGLADSTQALGKVYTRLSSGQRINQSSDDAAGLAVADVLRSQSRIYSAAVRNLQDAVSVVNITDGSLSQQSLILNRLAELAEQSANGTFGSSQRRTMQKEYEALVKEFGRIGDSTSFNGLSLLRSSRAGGPTGLTIQAGIDSRSSSLLQLWLHESGSMSGLVDLRRAAGQDYDGDGDAGTDQDIERFLDPQTLAELEERFGGQLMQRTVYSSDGAERNLLIGFIANDEGTRFSLVTFLEDPNTQTYSPTTQSQANFLSAQAGGFDFIVDPTTSRVSGESSVTLSDDLGGSFVLDLSALTFSTEEESNNLEFSGVLSQSQATAALDSLRRAMQRLTSARGEIGAFQSRLEIGLQGLFASRENTLAAESRIRDSDIATDAAELTRLQILRETSASVLARANQQPALVLQLLQA